MPNSKFSGPKCSRAAMPAAREIPLPGILPKEHCKYSKP